MLILLSNPSLPNLLAEITLYASLIQKVAEKRRGNASKIFADIQAQEKRNKPLCVSGAHTWWILKPLPDRGKSIDHGTSQCMGVNIEVIKRTITLGRHRKRRGLEVDCFCLKLLAEKRAVIVELFYSLREVIHWICRHVITSVFFKILL